MTEDKTAVAKGGHRARLSEQIERVTQDNPGLFTGPGTNTHLVGAEALFVLDPGEDSEEHFELLIEAIGDRSVRAILPSHGHRDHWPMAQRLAERLRAPVWAFRPFAEFRLDRMLADGERLEAPGVTLEVVHTPGHTRDHVCFWFPEERALFSGDHVMAWSTSIIAPPEGSLREFMASLDRLIELDRDQGIEVLYPAHGDAILDPGARMREIRDHRRQRTQQALRALAEAPATPAELVQKIYTDVDPKLHGAARMSLWAHLDALIEEGRVERSGGDPLSATYRLR